MESKTDYQFIHPFFFSFHKYLLSTSYASGIMFEVGNIKMGTKFFPVFEQFQ